MRGGESVLGWGDVNLATHNFAHWGGFSFGYNVVPFCTAAKATFTENALRNPQGHTHKVMGPCPCGSLEVWGWHTPSNINSNNINPISSLTGI